MKKLLFALIAIMPFVAFAQGSKNVRQLFDKKTIGEIRVTLTEKNWVDALDSLRLYGPGMLTGSVTIDGVNYEGVGIRFRGDKSYQRSQKRNPFSIKLNYSLADQNHQGYSAIKLSSALRDPSMVREILYSEIAGKYIPSAQACYTKLYVNEEFIGVFINVESIDKKFLETNFNSNSGPFFKAGVDYKPDVPTTCKQNIYGSLEFEDNVECYKNNFESYGKESWGDLQELTKALANDPAKLEKMLDIDRTLWMLALNNTMVNLSSYSGMASINYFLYKDNNGHFQTIPWDLNLSFGSYKNTGNGSDLDLKGLQNLDPLLHADNPYKPLISQLLKEPLYKKMYLAHIRQINEENFLNGSYERRAQELQGMIVVPYNDGKYNGYTLDEFQRSLRETVGRKSKIPGIVELMSKRTRYLKTHPELTPLPSAISEVMVQSRAKLDKQKVNAFKISAHADRFPKRLFVYYRFKDTDAYKSTMMTEDTSDGGSGVKAYSVSIEAPGPDAVLDYYLMAENAGTVSFLPANYTKAPAKVKLSDLNK